MADWLYAAVQERMLFFCYLKKGDGGGAGGRAKTGMEECQLNRKLEQNGKSNLNFGGLNLKFLDWEWTAPTTFGRSIRSGNLKILRLCPRPLIEACFPK